MDVVPPEELLELDPNRAADLLDRNAVGPALERIRGAVADMVDAHIQPMKTLRGMASQTMWPFLTPLTTLLSSANWLIRAIGNSTQKIITNNLLAIALPSIGKILQPLAWRPQIVELPQHFRQLRIGSRVMTPLSSSD
jgi:hypothetical protein